MSIEKWLSIPNFEGLYEASTCGRLRSLNPIKMKKLSFSHNKKYYYTTISKNGLTQRIGVHRLIAWTFLGKQEKGIEVRHINGNSLDNRIENLCYGTKSENMQDAIRHGSFSMSYWHPCAKLTKDQIREIFLSTVDYHSISKIYNIHPFTVHKIKRRKVRRLDTEDIAHLKPIILKNSKFNNMNDDQKKIALDLNISQRKASKILNISQRTIWRWRSKNK